MHIKQIQNILTAMTPRHAVQKTFYLYRNRSKAKGNTAQIVSLSMKMYGEIKVKLGAFINSALDEGSRSASRSGCLIPVERAPILM